MKREFTLTQQNFNYLRSIAAQFAGIELSDHKYEMLYGRLAKRLRKLKLQNFDEYCSLLKDGKNQAELTAFINAITTNLTSFFREQYHFQFLEQVWLAQLLAQEKPNYKIKIWSAGCSTGEEAYSLAITLKENLPENVPWDIKILGTDIDSEVLLKASKGIYPIEAVNKLGVDRLRRWFLQGVDTNAGLIRVKSELSELISFSKLNLIGSWPINGPFNIIFCRNVIIYFNRDTQRIIFNRFADLLEPGGILILGHSESLHGLTNRFQLIDKTIYRKIR